MFCVFFVHLIRTGDKHRDLDVNQFEFGGDHCGKYVAFLGRQSKTYQWGLIGKKQLPKRIVHYEDESNPRSLYKLLSLYLRHVPASGPLYRRPLESTDSHPIRFSAEVVGVNVLKRVVSHSMQEAGYEGYYTNHSILKRTCGTGLFQHFNDPAIVRRGRTGHTSNAVEQCKVMSTHQQKMTSAILDARAPSGPSEGASVVTEDESCLVTTKRKVKEQGSSGSGKKNCGMFTLKQPCDTQDIGRSSTSTRAEHWFTPTPESNQMQSHHSTPVTRTAESKDQNTQEIQHLMALCDSFKEEEHDDSAAQSACAMKPGMMTVTNKNSPITLPTMPTTSSTTRNKLMFTVQESGWTPSIKPVTMAVPDTSATIPTTTPMKFIPYRKEISFDMECPGIVDSFSEKRSHVPTHSWMSKTVTSSPPKHVHPTTATQATQTDLKITTRCMFDKCSTCMCTVLCCQHAQ